MGAIASIVLTDAAATPVAFTFTPSKQGLLGPSLSVAEFEARAANNGIPVGSYKVAMNFARPTKDRKTFRIGMKLELPVLEVTSNSTVSGIQPAPTISYKPIAELNWVLPERSSLQVRKDLRKMFATLLADTQVVNAVENLDFPY